jgi:hypothetical protein
MTTTPLAAGSKVVITKGCRDRDVTKGHGAYVVSITEIEGGAQRLALKFIKTGRVVSFYARHANRLADAEVSMNDGNPLHRITVKKIPDGQLAPGECRILPRTV